MATIILAATGEYLTFDATHRISVDKSNDVPEHPIDGVDFDFAGDHSQNRLNKLTIDAEVTETPWALVGGIVVGPQMAPKKLPVTLAPATTTNALLSVNRMADSQVFLERCRGELVTLVSRKLGVIEDCTFSSIRYDEDNLERLRFQIDLTVMQFAEAAFAALPPEVKRKAADVDEDKSGDAEQGNVKGETVLHGVGRALTGNENAWDGVDSEIQNNLIRKLGSWLQTPSKVP